jgi:hypothetical protein
MPDPEQETPPADPIVAQPESEAVTSEAPVAEPVPSSDSAGDVSDDAAMALGQDGPAEGPAVFTTASMRPDAVTPAAAEPETPPPSPERLASKDIDFIFTQIGPIPGVSGSTEFRVVGTGKELLGKELPHYISQSFISDTRPWRITSIELVGDGAAPVSVSLGLGLRYEAHIEASAWEGTRKLAVEFRVPSRQDAWLALALEDPSAKPNIVIHWTVD